MSTVLVDYGAEWRMLDLSSDDDTTDHSMDDLSTWALLEQPSGGDAGAWTGVPQWSPVVQVRPITTPSSAWWLAVDLVDVMPLALNLHFDARINVYFNGVFLTSTTNPDLVPVVSMDLPRAEGRLAIRVTQHVRGGLDGLYIDPQVEVASLYPVVRQYPRDDGAGLSAAPRLYPPPKRQQRVVGGFQ